MQVLEALSHWSAVQPNKKAWIFLNDKGDPVDDYTFAELDNASSYLCDYLVNTAKLQKGDRVMLVFFPGLDFTASLLACFKAQLIAVPVFPPDPRKLKKDLHHFISIQNSSDARVALTNHQFNFVKKVADIKHIFSGVKWPELKWITVDEQLKKGRGIPKAVCALPQLETIAFLQYTSGSTSEPKGVMISHQNLQHNLTMIIRELKANQSTVNVSWLPQYHDMGLIGSYLGIIYCGGVGYYMSPISFLKDPVMWLRAVSRYSGTHTQAPNFAYALVARKFREQMMSTQDKEQMDLSSMRHMINAAEPVDFKAILDFYHIFQPHHLANNVVVPTYGLAEHTVFVCSGGRQVLTVDKHALLEQNRVQVLEEEELVYNASAHGMQANHPVPESAHNLRIVGCGFPGRGEGVRAIITSPADGEDGNRAVTTLPDLEVGEIWLDSLSKAQGYWQQPVLSEHDFHAVLDSNDGHSYLRTGDMGFMYKDELFICGRSKDMIILGGSNHYPQDLERTVEQGLPDAIRAGCTAAIALSTNQLLESMKVKGHLQNLSFKDGGEAVIYMAELKEGVPSSQYAAIAQQCMQLISSEHGLSVRYVYLLPSRTIPKTTSGKIARSWCKRALLSNTLKVLYEFENPHAQNTADADEPRSGADGAGAGAGTKKGYEAVAQTDRAPPKLAIEALPLESIRGMEHPQLVYRLQLALQVVLGTSTGAAEGEKEKFIDEHQALVALGVDSMAIVQYKGVLENRFFCQVPDEFIFSTHCNLHELALAVHEGALTAEQKKRFNLGEDGERHGPGVEVVGNMPRQPLCPWFTCCY